MRGRARPWAAAVMAGVLAATVLPAVAAGAQEAARGQRPARGDAGTDSATTTPPRGDGPEHHPTELLVRYEAGTSPRDRAAIRAGHGLRKVRDLPVPDLELARITDGASPPQRAAAMANRPGVRYAEPNHVVHATDTTPTDPEFGQLWGLHNTGQAVGYSPDGFPPPDGGTADADIDAPEGWPAASGSEDVLVAVIDTGVDIAHEDLADTIWTNPGEIPGNGLDDDGNGYVDDVHGWDFANGDATVFDPEDGDDHGTHVAGTIAATWDNGVGVAGVSRARIMPLKFLGPGGGFVDDAVDALDYAIDNGADITNNSWGGTTFSQPMHDMIDQARTAGQLFVAAAGNGGDDGVGDDTDETPHYPSGYDVPNVVSVAATDRDDALATFSNFGPTTVDLAAPGHAVYSTVPQFSKVVATDGSVSWFSAHFAFNLAGVLDAADRESVAAATLATGGLDPVGLNVVVVDDDGGGTFEGAWQTALTALGATVTVCTEGSGPGPASSRCGGSDHLDAYDLAVWTVGSQTTDTLTSTNIAELTDHLTVDHGALVIEGIDLGYDLSGDDPTVSIPFFEDVLRSRYVADYDSNPRVEGAAGAFDGLVLELDPRTAAEYGQFYADALTTMPGGVTMMRGFPYTWFNGTSMAAPHVTGAAAQVLGTVPTISWQNLKARLLDTGDELPALADTTVSGRRLNFAAAIPTSVPEVTVTGIAPNPFSPDGDGLDDVTTVAWHQTEPATVTVKVRNASSQVVRTASLGARSAGTHAWDWDGRSGSGTTPVPDGTYTVTLAVTDGGGLTDADQASVTVDTPPPPTDPNPTDPDPTDPDPTDPAEPTVDRLSGDDRVRTAVAISKDVFARAGTVVLARGDTYPDALAGAPLAATLGGPILLTSSSELSEPTAAEIRRLDARHVVLLGGESALSSQVRDQLAALGVTVERVAGQDRFDTAGRIAERVGGRRVYVTEGVNADPNRGWPDAVAVSALAAFQQRPILLVARDAVPEATARAIDDLGATHATIVGGGASVSDVTEGSLRARGVAVDRISGADRFQTSVEVAQRAEAAGMAVARPWLATGLNYPDALVAGPAVAADGGVLLLLHGESLDLSPASQDWVHAHAAGITRAVVVGGTGVVSEQVMAQVTAAVAP